MKLCMRIFKDVCRARFVLIKILSHFHAIIAMVWLTVSFVKKQKDSRISELLKSSKTSYHLVPIFQVNALAFRPEGSMIACG